MGKPESSLYFTTNQKISASTTQQIKNIIFCAFLAEPFFFIIISIPPPKGDRTKFTSIFYISSITFLIVLIPDKLFNKVFTKRVLGKITLKLAFLCNGDGSGLLGDDNNHRIADLA